MNTLRTPLSRAPAPAKTHPLPVHVSALFALCIMLAVPPAVSASAAAADERIVQIHVARQIQNPFLPWQSTAPADALGYGYFINDTQVLTTENLVRNQTLVELVRPASGEKITARVEIADHLLNMAILRIGQGPAVPDSEPVQTPGQLPLGATVTILQFDADRNVQHGDAKITQIGVTRLPSAPYSLLSYRLLSDLDITGEGAPVVQDGQLCGIIVSYHSSTRIAVMISEPFISRFLKDALQAPYLGPASAGFTWRSLVDPAKRKYLDMGDEKGGIQVVTPFRGTPGGKTLRPLDVILEWDGHALDSLGFYEDPFFGRQKFSHLVRGKRSPGDRVQLTVFREGKAEKLEMRLSGDPDHTALVPENVTRQHAEYLVEGGFILRELDMAYMRAVGSDWRARADSRLLHYYLSSRSSGYQPGDRVVVLVGVLPDDINIGYHQQRNQVVETVNDHPIRNLQDVFRIVNADGALHRLRLKGTGVDLVLDQDELSDANSRIMKRYRIPDLRYQAAAPSQAQRTDQQPALKHGALASSTATQ